MQPTTLSETKRKLLDAMLRGESSVAPDTIERRSPSDATRLGLAQQEVWRRSHETGDLPPLYNETVTVYREGPLDVHILEQAFGEILRRHEAWRTTFKSVDGVPMQVVHPWAGAPEIDIVDLRDFPSERRESTVTLLLSESAQQPFDLEQGPLLRAQLFRMDDESYRFTIVAHQSIVDGVSIYQVLPAELAAIYEAFSTGQLSPLPELTLQYADFTNWQRRWLDAENLEKQKAFWRWKLSPPLEPLILSEAKDPSRTCAAGSESFRGVIRPFKVPPPLNAILREVTQREGVTLFMTLLAGFAALLNRYTGQNDIILGTLSPAGRKRLETQKLMGYFLNPVALRFDFSGRPSFHELLLQTRSVIAEAISHDDVPLEDIAKEVGIVGRDPFVKIAMSLQPQVPRTLSGWNVTSMDAQNGGSVWDLYLAFIEGRSGLIGRAQFNPDVFSEETITSTLDDLWQILHVLTQ